MMTIAASYQEIQSTKAALCKRTQEIIGRRKRMKAALAKAKAEIPRKR